MRFSLRFRIARLEEGELWLAAESTDDAAEEAEESDHAGETERAGNSVRSHVCKTGRLKLPFLCIARGKITQISSRADGRTANSSRVTNDGPDRVGWRDEHVADARELADERQAGEVGVHEIVVAEVVDDPRWPWRMWRLEAKHRSRIPFEDWGARRERRDDRRLEGRWGNKRDGRRQGWRGRRRGGKFWWKTGRAGPLILIQATVLTAVPLCSIDDRQNGGRTKQTTRAPPLSALSDLASPLVRRCSRWRPR
jgi:hypothetical protein